MSSPWTPCPPVVLSSLVGKRNWPLSGTGEPCPDVGPLRLCSCIAFLLSVFTCSLAEAASLSPVILLASSFCLSLILSSSSPPVLLSVCSPRVALLSLWRCLVAACPSFVPFCFPSLLLLALLMSSSGLSVVLLLSCCLCRFPTQGPGLRPPTTATTVLAD